MTVPGSYANGFAPRDGQPLYPELWRGCVGAWAPCLGPTGLTLRDWSGFGNHGTLTNMVAGDDWVPNQGRYALDFDGSNDYVILSKTITLTGRFSASFWIYLRNIASLQMILEDYSSAMNLYVFSNMLRFGARDNGPIENASGTIAANTWLPVTVTMEPTQSVIYINGAVNSVKAASLGSLPISIPRLFSRGASQFFPNCLLSEMSIYNRTLSASEAALLATRRGIAYEFAPRRRSRIFTGGFRAYWADRKAQIIGGGL
jgi:hypothetical protein